MIIKEDFEFDRLISDLNFCNFKKEKKDLGNYVDQGDCVKLYGPRNFGKTSLAKNIIAQNWLLKNIDKRVIIYADFFSIDNLDDISQEMTRAFNHGINAKKNLMEKGIEWMSSLKKLRPTWVPPTDSNSFGEFSVTSEKLETIIDFQIIFENINELQVKNKFEFLIILDEFQEINKIKKAEAQLRGALQLFTLKIPVIILGSKHHLLSNIFEKPKAPFYSWGHTIEFHPIAYQEFYKYMEIRFNKFNKSLAPEASVYLQDHLNRIPESMNRFCDYLSHEDQIKKISFKEIDQGMKDFVDKSRGTYEYLFSSFSTTEKKIIRLIAKKNRAHSLLGNDFLKELDGVPKSTVAGLVTKLLNDSIISQNFSDKSEKNYWITDPFFSYYLKVFKN
jgi:hypothetical protein